MSFTLSSTLAPLVARDVAKAYGDRVVLDDAGSIAKPGDLPTWDGGLVVSVRDVVVPGRVSVPRLDVSRGGRLLVTGANGSGTSTLLKVLVGDLHPTSGTAHVSARRVGYLRRR